MFVSRQSIHDAHTPTNTDQNPVLNINKIIQTIPNNDISILIFLNWKTNKAVEISILEERIGVNNYM